MQATARRERLWWAAVGAIALAGFALRIIAARGGLWTDEAWSVIYAAEARDALGVFLRINHDNNHHLYSLWLQAIGPTASPLLARAPAILAGSLCTIAAAILVGRRSRGGGIVAALLFSVTPTLVVFGSEARGYAMMLLAALIMLLLVSDALERRSARWRPWALAVVATFGMLSHMTMAAPVAIATLWYYVERRRQCGPKRALRDAIRLMGPALIATAAVIAFVFTAAALSPAGMRLGGYLPFSGRDYIAALDDLTLWSAGLEAPLPWLVPLLACAAAVLIALRRPDWLGSRALLYALLILAVPVGALVLRAGNSGFPRYYLASVVGVLLLASEWIARGLAGRAPVRAAAALLLVTVIGVGAYRDTALVQLQRGMPARPVTDMAALSPGGARVALDQRRLQSVVTVAALRRGYPVHFATGCGPADFLLAAQLRWTPTPATVDRCGVQMEAIDSSVTVPLTGESWVLYKRQSLQRLEGADSGPAPGARNSRLSGRAGVAQG